MEGCVNFLDSTKPLVFLSGVSESSDPVLLIEIVVYVLNCLPLALIRPTFRYMTGYFGRPVR